MENVSMKLANASVVYWLVLTYICVKKFSFSEYACVTD